MMKKSLLVSYVAGIFDNKHGEPYGNIIRLFIPEFVIAFLIYFLPLWIDAYLIGCLKSTSTYGTLGYTTNLLHFIMKIAEGLSVGTVILSGFYNGKQEFENVGRSLRDAFWVTVVTGATFATLLYVGAPWIYGWYVPKEMIALGVPFLRMRAVGIFFMFVSYAFLGFLRGIKNTRVPMQIYIAGVLTFIIADVVLIRGHLGCPQLGLTGSAIASILQHVVMAVYAMVYVLRKPEYRIYSIHLLKGVTNYDELIHLLQLSWPVMIDKATLAGAYIWLGAMFRDLGQYTAATFIVVKDIERLAFLPAIALAQVITFLVSNDYGQKNWEGIKSNIKKVAFLASCMVLVIIVVLMFYAEQVIGLFDHRGEFTPMAAAVFPVMSVLLFFDLVQLLLAGALRGASNVRLVMMVRLIICTVFFAPVSYLCSQIPMENVAIKFMLIYGSYYVGNLLMSVIYIQRLRSEEWKKKAAQ
jgi:multidrug resistance protein, MATE family